MLPAITARLVAPLILSAAVFAAGVAADRMAPLIGANAQLSRLQADRDDWKAQADEAARANTAWRASFAQSEALRRQDQAAAVQAVNAAQASCDGRVAAARKSALAIHQLVTKDVPHDAQGCPSRVLLDPRELRDAVRPAAARP